MIKVTVLGPSSMSGTNCRECWPGTGGPTHMCQMVQSLWECHITMGTKAALETDEITAACASPYAVNCCCGFSALFPTALRIHWTTGHTQLDTGAFLVSPGLSGRCHKKGVCFWKDCRLMSCFSSHVWLRKIQEVKPNDFQMWKWSFMQ